MPSLFTAIGLLYTTIVLGMFADGFLNLKHLKLRVRYPSKPKENGFYEILKSNDAVGDICESMLYVIWLLNPYLLSTMYGYYWVNGWGLLDCFFSFFPSIGCLNMSYWIWVIGFF